MILTDLHSCRTPFGVFYLSTPCVQLHLNKLCSDGVLTLLEFGFYLFVSLFINASALCTWLRHPHVTASMPRSWSGCVTHIVAKPSGQF